MSGTGFQEVGHGADAAIEVWAPDMAELFHQSLLGMLVLMGVETVVKSPCDRSLDITTADDESLLVAFLSQVLFVLEQERLVLSVNNLDLKPGRLVANLAGLPLRSIQREIKAVTFNDLAINQANTGLTVKIVFDL